MFDVLKIWKKCILIFLNHAKFVFERKGNREIFDVLDEAFFLHDHFDFSCISLKCWNKCF